VGPSVQSPRSTPPPNRGAAPLQGHTVISLRSGCLGSGSRGRDRTRRTTTSFSTQTKPWRFCREGTVGRVGSYNTFLRGPRALSIAGSGR
jgi:hypothetical protein